MCLIGVVPCDGLTLLFYDYRTQLDFEINSHGISSIIVSYNYRKRLAVVHITDVVVLIDVDVQPAIQPMLVLLQLVCKVRTFPVCGPSSAYYLASQSGESRGDPSSRMTKQPSSSQYLSTEEKKYGKQYPRAPYSSIRRLANLLPDELVKPLVFAATGVVDSRNDKRHFGLRVFME